MGMVKRKMTIMLIVFSVLLALALAAWRPPLPISDVYGVTLFWQGRIAELEEGDADNAMRILRRRGYLPPIRLAMFGTGSAPRLRLVDVYGDIIKDVSIMGDRSLFVGGWYFFSLWPHGLTEMVERYAEQLIPIENFE